MTTREKLHQLIDQLPEGELQAVLIFLQEHQAGHRELPEEDPTHEPPHIGDYDDPETIALLKQRHEQAMQDLKEGKTVPLTAVTADFERWQARQTG